jgi:hypothetical protein
MDWRPVITRSLAIRESVASSSTSAFGLAAIAGLKKRSPTAVVLLLPAGGDAPPLRSSSTFYKPYCKHKRSLRGCLRSEHTQKKTALI